MFYKTTKKYNMLEDPSFYLREDKIEATQPINFTEKEIKDIQNHLHLEKWLEVYNKKNNIKKAGKPGSKKFESNKKLLAYLLLALFRKQKLAEQAKRSMQDLQKLYPEKRKYQISDQFINDEYDYYNPTLYMLKGEINIPQNTTLLNENQTRRQCILRMDNTDIGLQVFEGLSDLRIFWKNGWGLTKVKYVLSVLEFFGFVYIKKGHLNFDKLKSFNSYSSKKVSPVKKVFYRENDFKHLQKLNLNETFNQRIISKDKYKVNERYLPISFRTLPDGRQKPQRFGKFLSDGKNHDFLKRTKLNINLVHAQITKVGLTQPANWNNFDKLFSSLDDTISYVYYLMYYNANRSEMISEEIFYKRQQKSKENYIKNKTYISEGSNVKIKAKRIAEADTDIIYSKKTIRDNKNPLTFGMFSEEIADLNKKLGKSFKKSRNLFSYTQIFQDTESTDRLKAWRNIENARKKEYGRIYNRFQSIPSKLRTKIMKAYNYEEIDLNGSTVSVAYLQETGKVNKLDVYTNFLNKLVNNKPIEYLRSDLYYQSKIDNPNIPISDFKIQSIIDKKTNIKTNTSQFQYLFCDANKLTKKEIE